MSQSVSETPADVLFRMIGGLRNSQAIYVVAQLGVADLLANGVFTSDDLAAKLGVHARSLFRVMRALAAQGVFKQDSSDRFGLTPISELLRTDNPHTLRYMAIFTGEEYYRAAGDLLYTVKTGEVAFNHIYGKGHFEFLGENPESAKIFNQYMATSQSRFGSPFESYDFTGRTLVVDVGGGQGHVIAPIIKSSPGINGIVYDLPQGITDTRAFLEAQGIDQRCKIVAGSFFDSVPSGGDVYLLSRILHDWPDDKARLILENCHKSIRENGVLLLREHVIPEADAPSFGKQLDLTMLFMLGGAERTEKEWRKLLQDSGFALSRIIKTGQSFDLIEAKPT